MVRPPRTCLKSGEYQATPSNVKSRHFRLTQEISELQVHLTRLNSKLSEAETAMKMLKNTKRELKDDLNVKALSLVIDRQRCMAIRLNFPYHTRCVCSSLKEDETQVPRTSPA